MKSTGVVVVKYVIWLSILAGFMLMDRPQARQLFNQFPQTDSEFALLPPYCKVKMRADKKSPEYRMWDRRLAGGFKHIHHYCAALNELNTADRVVLSHPVSAQELLRDAIKQIAYVEKHADPNFVLMPQMLVTKGKIYLRLKDPGKAVQAFKAAIAKNPRYSGGYIALSDFFRSVGKREEALRVVREGMQQVPASKGLKRRLRELQQ